MAHQAAASKILEQNNSGRPATELDLHGLHTTEATAALDAHIASTLWFRPCHHVFPLLAKRVRHPVVKQQLLRW